MSDKNNKAADVVFRELEPRFPLLPPVLDARQQQIHDRIAAGPRGRVRGPLAMMLYSPDFAEHGQALGEFARYRSSFPPALSELVILIIARRNNCRHEWVIHAPIAAAAGVPAEAIEAIRTGRAPEFADGAMRLVHEFASEMLRTNRVGDGLYARFQEAFGTRGVIDMTAIMGYYTLVAFMLNAARPEAETGDAIPVSY